MTFLGAIIWALSQVLGIALIIVIVIVYRKKSKK